jgi:uncharacterized membrane protein
MPMTSLILAALTFTVLHLFVAGTALRGVLVARLGERPYQGLFSLASAGVLGWLIWAYVKVRVPAPTPLAGLGWLAGALVLIAFALVVLGLMTPGPTVVGGEKLLAREHPARGIHRITRHPFLWGVALWAAVHLVYNPGAVNLVFFGTFLVVAVAGTFSIDAKRSRAFGQAWQRYAGLTSNIPFAAVAGKRNTLVPAEFGWLAPVIAVAVFVTFALLHARFFGLPPF